MSCRVYPEPDYIAEVRRKDGVLFWELETTEDKVMLHFCPGHSCASLKEPTSTNPVTVVISFTLYQQFASKHI